MGSYWREVSYFNKVLYIAQAVLELVAVPQPQPPKFWNYRHAPLYLAKGGFLYGNI